MRYGAEFVRECLPSRAKMSLCGLGVDDPKARLLDVVGSRRRKARLDARRHEKRARARRWIQRGGNIRVAEVGRGETERGITGGA